LWLCPVKDLKVQNFRYASSQIFDLSLKNQSKKPNQRFGGVSGRCAQAARSEAFIGYSQCYAAFFIFLEVRVLTGKWVSPTKLSCTLRTNYFYFLRFLKVWQFRTFRRFMPHSRFSLLFFYLSFTFCLPHKK